MRSFLKPAILAHGGAIGALVAFSAILGFSHVGGAPVEPKGTSTSEMTIDPKKVKGAKVKVPKGPKDENDDSTPLTLPLPKGEPQHSVKFPLYGADGVLNYRFDIGVATPIDNDLVKMQKLAILSFKPDEKNPGKQVEDMHMDLPDAVLNQKTRDLTSDSSIVIKCESYEVTGKQVRFNLATRQGTLGGGVKMIIYDMDKLKRGEKAAPTLEVDSKKVNLKK